MAGGGIVTPEGKRKDAHGHYFTHLLKLNPCHSYYNKIIKCIFTL